MPEWVELRRKTGQRGLLIASYKKLGKRLWSITPVVEAVRVPAHLVLLGSQQAKQLRRLHAQLSLGQSCHRKKKSYANARRVTLVVSESATLYTVACQTSLSGRRILKARILEHIGQYWLPYPSRALYFLLP